MIRKSVSALLLSAACQATRLYDFEQVVEETASGELKKIRFTLDSEYHYD